MWQLHATSSDTFLVEQHIIFDLGRQYIDPLPPMLNNSTVKSSPKCPPICSCKQRMLPCSTMNCPRHYIWLEATCRHEIMATFRNFPFKGNIATWDAIRGRLLPPSQPTNWIRFDLIRKWQLTTLTTTMASELSPVRFRCKPTANKFIGTKHRWSRRGELPFWRRRGTVYVRWPRAHVRGCNVHKTPEITNSSIDCRPRDCGWGGAGRCVRTFGWMEMWRYFRVFQYRKPAAAHSLARFDRGRCSADVYCWFDVRDQTRKRSSQARRWSLAHRRQYRRVPTQPAAVDWPSHSRTLDVRTAHREDR